MIVVYFQLLYVYFIDTKQYIFNVGIRFANILCIVKLPMKFKIILT